MAIYVIVYSILSCYHPIQTAVMLPFHFFRKNETKNRHHSQTASLSRVFVMSEAYFVRLMSCFSHHSHVRYGNLYFTLLESILDLGIE